MKTNLDYYKLKLMQKKYPELTFDNNGYQYLDPYIKHKYHNQIKEIENILKNHIDGFVRFDNFKFHKNNNSFDIRCQYKWDEKFTGVGYFEIKYFSPLFIY